jgi:hypothetical protein
MSTATASTIAPTASIFKKTPTAPTIPKVPKVKKIKKIKNLSSQHRVTYKKKLKMQLPIIDEEINFAQLYDNVCDDYMTHQQQQPQPQPRYVQVQHQQPPPRYMQVQHQQPPQQYVQIQQQQPTDIDIEILELNDIFIEDAVDDLDMLYDINALLNDCDWNDDNVSFDRECHIIYNNLYGDLNDVFKHHEFGGNLAFFK